MEEYIYFSNFVTKSLQPINSEDRYFEGYLTVQVKDKQGEITIVDELYKVLPIWMDRGAPISDTHSNRIIGKGINYAKTEYIDKDGTKYPAIKITGKIHKNYELDNEIWQKIKSGEYKGLSFGGATRTSREPVVMKDGSIAYALKELEHYEVAVCKDPAVPLALITDHNSIAKAMAGHTEDRGDKMLIQCSKFGCYINKGKNFDAKTGKLNLENPNEGDGTQAMLDSQNKVIATGGNKQLEEIKRLQSHGAKKSQEIGTANAGGTRFSGKEYNQGGEQTTQITEVQNPEEDTKAMDKKEDLKDTTDGELEEVTKDPIVNKILPALGAITGVIGRGIVGGIANTAASSGGASDDEKVDDTKKLKAEKKEKEQKQFARDEELEVIHNKLGSKKDVDNSLLHITDVKKAFMIVEKIVPLVAQAILPMLTGGEEEEVEKADLSKLSTFKGKEQALIDEGKSKESAEKIVGSFVKHENKADAPVTTSTEGVNNPVYSDKEKEIEKTAGLSHANTHGDGNQGSQDVGRQSWAGSGSPYPKIINESRNNKIKSINLDCNILKNKLKRI